VEKIAELPEIDESPESPGVEESLMSGIVETGKIIVLILMTKSKVKKLKKLVR
jgi:hypothetical protein